jgi:hypothetical protein
MVYPVFGDAIRWLVYCWLYHSWFEHIDAIPILYVDLPQLYVILSYIIAIYGYIYICYGSMWIVCATVKRWYMVYFNPHPSILGILTMAKSLWRWIDDYLPRWVHNSTLDRGTWSNIIYIHIYIIIYLSSCINYIYGRHVQYRDVINLTERHFNATRSSARCGTVRTSNHAQISSTLVS